MLVHPWASQDEVSGWSFLHHERDVIFMQAANAERYCGGERMNATTAQRFAENGVDGWFLGAVFPLEVESLEKLMRDEVSCRPGVNEHLHGNEKFMGENLDRCASEAGTR